MTGREAREGMDGSPGAVVYGMRYPPGKSLLILQLCQFTVLLVHRLMVLTLGTVPGIVQATECLGFGEGSCMVAEVG